MSTGRKFTSWQGQDLTPEYDFTDPLSDVNVIWEEVEVGGRAWKGESDIGTIPLRDERGQTGNPANLPSGLTHISLAAHNRWRWTERNGSNTVARGWIGPKDYMRDLEGGLRADRYREVRMSVLDANEQLKGIIVDENRGPETDVAFVEHIRTTYLNGSPDPTRVIADTYISSSNTVMLPARRVYGDPRSVLAEVASFANKETFVTVNEELFYDGWDSTAYAAGIRISDRIDEINTELACPPSEFAPLGSVGTATSNSGNNFASAYAPWVGDNEERVQVTLSQDIPAGYSLIAFVETNIDGGSGALYPHQVYDEQGNTWTRDAVSPDTGSENYTVEIWSCNVTDALSAGDYVRFAMNVGSSLNVVNESGVRSLGVLAFSGTLSNATPGTEAENFGGSPAIASSATADLVVVGASGHYATADDPDWSDGFSILAAAGAGDRRTLYANYLMPGANEPYSFSVSQNSDWTITSVGYTTGISGDGAVTTFPPIWDVGPAATEDGQQLLSGLRMYYGAGSNTYVYVSSPTTVNQYGHYEESMYAPESITTAAAATTLANAVLARRRFEDRNINVSIGPLTEEQIGCVEYGQLINIKARAISFADDQFFTGRIRQLHWTTPVPGMFFAHMQIERPIKEQPYGVGNRAGTEAVTSHVLQGSNAHPEFVLRATLTQQGDLPYRGASDWTRLAIGASNTHLISDGIVPKWVANTGGGGGVTSHDSLTDVSIDDHHARDHAARHEPGGADAITGFVEASNGGKEVINVVAASGATETLDLADGNVHDVTLTDNCTLTLTGSTNGVACYMTVLLRQDGTGSRLVAWPGSVEWVGGSAPTLQTAANSWDLVVLLTLDGGTTWFAQHAGTSGSDTKWIVDPGSPSYSGSGPVTVALTSVFGIDSSGNPYYNAAGVTDGEEAALGWDSETETYFLRPYYP